MQKIFSREFMEQNRGCYSINQLNACSFMRTNDITLESIVNSEIPLKDKFWFLCKKVATKEQNQIIAIKVAAIVLPVYERRYPEDTRPREAIEAARRFISGHIDIDALIMKKRAAYAAAYAAYAYAAYAYAAYAAAYTACTAYADYAADAAADAAYAAYAAADDAAIKDDLFGILTEFCNF